MREGGHHGMAVNGEEEGVRGHLGGEEASSMVCAGDAGEGGHGRRRGR